MIEKQIAVLARQLVEGRIDRAPKHDAESDYRSLCESFPIFLRTSGLTRSVTFLDAKRKVQNGEPANAQAWLLQHLQMQLQELRLLPDKNTELPKHVVRADLSSKDYRQLSYLALRIAYWHKRLAQALLRSREDGE